jgi:hypothetical protein
MAPKAKAQGVAVVASGGARDDAFALARAVYASSLRPRGLDELRARILAGEPAPPTATKDVRELAELRAAVAGEDAASRRLLGGIAQQLGVQALLVVGRAPSARTEAHEPRETAEAEKGSASDAGAPSAAAGPSSVDAGAQATAGPSSVDAGAQATAAGASAEAGAPSAAPAVPVVARLFLAETGDFDAARYEPDASGWRGTVASLSGRFPPPPALVTAQLQGPPPKLSSEGKQSRPFYASPWLWGAVGAAVLIGGFFFFATQDSSDDPIHLQMRVPR